MDRNEIIHSKGFDLLSDNRYLSESAPNEYSRIKVGIKTLDDATLNLGSLKASLPGYEYVKKPVVMQALATNDLRELRNISNFYYNISGIYQTACNYFAFLYRYDWLVEAESFSTEEIKEEKIFKDYIRVLNYLDNSNIKKICGDIALSVIKEGAYYGYIVPSSDGLVLQQLPIEYCRSKYTVRGLPAVEFNMKFFDKFSDPGYRLKILKLFPDEFSEGYKLYKQNRLRAEFPGDESGGWYLLDPENCVKFNFNNNDLPILINAIPALIDLDAAQDLDRRKQMQKLLKILIQKLPLDKNGDLIFDVDEARDIHNNAVQMLKRAIGVDVLTTFADIDSVDMSDKNTTTSTDDLEKVERAVFNSLGISQNLFNTDGNLSLQKSILNDESSVRNLLLQFQIFFNRVTKAIGSSSKKYSFKFYMLETTQYNYQELAKIYKEQSQMGFSRMLPQIALGHSQSFILNTAHFENEVLHLQDIMMPPLLSSTLSSQDVLGKSDKSNIKENQNNTKVTEQQKESGRPQKSDDQKSEKTIQNKESMS